MQTRESGLNGKSVGNTAPRTTEMENTTMKNSSTSSLGRMSVQSNMGMSQGQRDRSMSQDSRSPLPVYGKEDNEMANQMSATRKENAMLQQKLQGSGQRKRSRLFEDNSSMFVKEGLTKKETAAQKTKIDSILQHLHGQIEQVFLKGERAKTLINKLAVLDTFRTLGFDIFQLLSSVINLQDEKMALQYQVIQLQAQIQAGSYSNSNVGSQATNTYLQAAMSAQKATVSSIISGKNLPLSDIPNNLRHAPSERIIIFKAKEKGVQQTKAQHEEFRKDLNLTIGNELMGEVDAIRPTRNGGHTLIFQSEQARNSALEVFRTNERAHEVEEDRSCLIAPKKKYAKVVCRDPPTDVTIEDAQQALHGRNNPHLCQIPIGSRSTKIIETRFGWIFEMSSHEAAAVQAQGGRIRLGNAREIRVEEYIPLQQCYNCCAFGHKAKDCLSETSYCRLCGIKGHSGWDCPDKDERGKWRCTNCIINNETKGLQLPVNHAAAQLHKCPCALSHRENRKAQLAAAGIYTTPLTSATISLQSGRPLNATITSGNNGAQVRKISRTAVEVRKKNRSRSTKRAQQNEMIAQQTEYLQPATSAPSIETSTASSSSSTIENRGRQQARNLSAYANRPVKINRPKSYDTWKTAGRQTEGGISTESRGRDREYQRDGTNSTSNLPTMALETIQKPSLNMQLDDDG